MREAPTGKHPLADAVAIYTDGGLLSSNPSKIGGSWAWVAVDETGVIPGTPQGAFNDDLGKFQVDPRGKVGFKSGLIFAPEGKVISNNHSEQVAIVRALEAVPYGWSGNIYTDSEVALKRVESDYESYCLGIKRFPAGELNLYKSISDRSKEAVRRLGKVRFVLLQGHPTKADLERGIGAKRNLPVSKWNCWCDKRCEQEKKRYYARIAAELEAA